MESNLKKFELSITAHVGDKVMEIFSQEFTFNIMTHEESFIYILRNMMPTVDWRFDDGDISIGTEYLQYVDYPDGSENYLLATWSKVKDYKEIELFDK